AFIFPNFVIVAALGALYVYLGDLQPVNAIFYGVSPAVIALILHSCYRLAKRSAAVSGRGCARDDQPRPPGDHRDLRWLSGRWLLGIARLHDRDLFPLLHPRAC